MYTLVDCGSCERVEDEKHNVVAERGNYTGWIWRTTGIEKLTGAQIDEICKTAKHRIECG